MDGEKIQKLASLARIGLKTEELEGLRKDLGSIVQYVSQVEEVSLQKDGNTSSTQSGFLREDISPHETGVFSKDIIDSFPDKEGDYLKVKKIL